MDPKNPDFQAAMASFLQNAQKMQENFREISEKNKDKTVVGKAGGDLVKVHVNLRLQLTAMELAPSLFEENPAVISELIIAAVNQGIYEAQQAVKNEMMEVTKKMGLPPEFSTVDDKK